MESSKKNVRRITQIILLAALMFASPLAANAKYEEIQDTCELKIHTPSLSCRKTAKLRLPNGLSLYLISDPKADASGAALTVGRGHWSDPIEYPGMAHLVEHLLFMGTKAYPGENDFMSFVADHGGKTNAYTASDHTAYLFTSNHESFYSALDRFAHFFIDPLLNADSVKRELHNVDQEHSKNKENDLWRKYMIFKEMGNPKHPNRSFSTGNSDTLSIIPIETLRKWVENNYSSNLMYAVVYSSLPLDELKEKASALFSQVPNRNLVNPLIEEGLFSADQKGHLVAIKPIRDLQLLSLEWELPNALLPDDTKSSKLISYALRRGSENSLTETLKKEGLIQNLDIGIDRFGKKNILFSIQIELTAKGVEEKNKVIERCFQAIKMLKTKGVPLYLYQEMTEMAKRNYEFQTREDPFYFLMNQIDPLHDEPLSSFPQKTVLPSSYDPKVVKAYLTHFTPYNCQFSLIADPQKSKIAPSKKEKWMGGEYSIIHLSKEQLDNWEKVSLHPEMSLPESNPFLPTKLSMLPDSDLPQNAPLKLMENEYAKAFYFQDLEAPHTHLFLHLQSSSLNNQPLSSTLADLYLKHLDKALSPLLRSAEAAGIYTSFSLERQRLNIRIQGYSEKAPLFLQNLLKEMKENAPTHEEFQNYKDALLRSYANVEKELPLAQARELLSSIVRSKASVKEKRKALESLHYEDFLNFQESLFQTAFLEALFAGNLTPQESEAMLLDTVHHLAYEPLPAEKRPQEKVLILPSSQGPFVSHHHTHSQGHAAILLLEEGTFSFEKRAAQQILSTAIKEAFFDTLRTKQKTGYIVSSDDDEIQRHLFQTFMVQSSTHHPKDLLFRFELFLEDFVENMHSSISQERFENIKKNLITLLENQGRSLSERAKLADLFAFQYDEDFHWIEKRIKSFQDLSYESFLSYSKSVLSKENKKRLAILFQGKAKEFAYEEITLQKIKEISSYSTGL